MKYFSINSIFFGNNFIFSPSISIKKMIRKTLHSFLLFHRSSYEILHRKLIWCWLFGDGLSVWWKKDKLICPGFRSFDGTFRNLIHLFWMWGCSWCSSTSHRYLLSSVIGSRLRCDCWPDARPGISGIEAKGFGECHLGFGWESWTEFYLASCLDSFTESTTTRLTAECMSDKLVLGRVNNEGAIFHVLTDTQKAQVANACLDNYLVIVLNILREKSILLFVRQCSFCHFNSPHSVGRQSSMARLTHLQTSNYPEPFRRQSWWLHRLSCSCRRLVALQNSRDIELSGSSSVLPWALGKIVLLNKSSLTQSPLKLIKHSPCLIRRCRFSVGKSVGRTARFVDVEPLLPPSICTERSIMIFLQMSLLDRKRKQNDFPS